MAKIQTRRSISVSVEGHKRIARAAKAAGLSVSGYVEQKIIRALPPLEVPTPAPARGRRR